MASVADQIRGKNEQFMGTLRHQDAAGLAAMYSADARLFPPGAEMIASTSKIEAFWQQAISSGLSDAKLETLDVDLIGGYTAIETGRFTLYAGKSVIDRGKYIVVWRNEDGLWKLHRDIWNSSVAVASPAAVGA